MKWPRPTIAAGMVLTVFAASNAGLARVYLADFEFFEGIAPLVAAFQVGLAGVILGRGRARRFWLGFLAAGVAATLGLIVAEEFPTSTWGGSPRYAWTRSASATPTGRNRAIHRLRGLVDDGHVSSSGRRTSRRGFLGSSALQRGRNRS